MNVAVDVTPLAQTRAGTARYLNALLPRIERDVAVERVSGFAKGRAGTLWLDLAWYPHRLEHDARGADVLHCTTYRGPVRGKLPVVVTVHDIAVFRMPEAFPPWTRRYSRTVVPRVLRHARRVIAVSEFTAAELESALGVPRDMVRVVPNAVDAVFSPDGPRADGDYVLAVGTLEPRKNVERVLAAARRVGVPVRVAGARGWGGVEARGDGVTWLGEVADEELARQYRGALCLAYPSLYEGFGIPVLEAMACGTPVVTSAGGATEEVAGGAAVLVDPLDAAAVAAGIEEASSRRDELCALGLERAAAYSWDESARRTVDVYREAAA
ncbi:MAG TPA: glycosyltransferase family 1 protein [Gaiellaceae bacterium]|nr:glycosyltransferase family 1 protein [Gaiellaceae bacterium]